MQLSKGLGRASVIAALLASSFSRASDPSNGELNIGVSSAGTTLYATLPDPDIGPLPGSLTLNAPEFGVHQLTAIAQYDCSGVKYSYEWTGSALAQGYYQSPTTSTNCAVTPSQVGYLNLAVTVYLADGVTVLDTEAISNLCVVSLQIDEENTDRYWPKGSGTDAEFQCVLSGPGSGTLKVLVCDEDLTDSFSWIINESGAQAGTHADSWDGTDFYFNELPSGHCKWRAEWPWEGASCVKTYPLTVFEAEIDDVDDFGNDVIAAPLPGDDPVPESPKLVLGYDGWYIPFFVWPYDFTADDTVLEIRDKDSTLVFQADLPTAVAGCYSDLSYYSYTWDGKQNQGGLSDFVDPTNSPYTATIRCDKGEKSSEDSIQIDVEARAFCGRAYGDFGSQFDDAATAVADLGYTVLKDTSMSKADALSAEARRLVWYSFGHGVEDDDVFVGIGTTTDPLLPSALVGGQHYRLVFFNSCNSAQDDVWHDAYPDAVYDFIQKLGPDAYVGWSTEVSPGMAAVFGQVFMGKLNDADATVQDAVDDACILVTRAADYIRIVQGADVKVDLAP